MPEVGGLDCENERRAPEATISFKRREEAHHDDVKK